MEQWHRYWQLQQRHNNEGDVDINEDDGSHKLTKVDEEQMIFDVMKIILD